MSKIKKPNDEILEYIKNNYTCDPILGQINSKYLNNIGYIHTTKSRAIYKISIGKRKIMRAHISWFLYYGEWPELEIDHEDRNSLNDRIKNLRQVTSFVQQQNKENYKGYRGFSIERTYETNRVRWKRYKVHNQTRKIYVGRYFTRENAIKGIDEYWARRGLLGMKWNFDAEQSYD